MKCARGLLREKRVDIFCVAAKIVVLCFSGINYLQFQFHPRVIQCFLTSIILSRYYILIPLQQYPRDLSKQSLSSKATGGLSMRRMCMDVISRTEKCEGINIEIGVELNGL